jgi:hypothetical protein
MSNMSKNINQSQLTFKHNPDETIPILYKFSKFQYDCGGYQKTSSI